MSKELEQVRSNTPPAAGPDPALVARERQALMTLIRQTPGTALADPDEVPSAEGRPTSMTSPAVVPLAGRRRRLVLPALGAAAAVALVVAGVAALSSDGPGRTTTAATDPTVSTPAVTPAQEGAFDAVEAWLAAWDRQDSGAARALLGPRATATFEELERRREAPGFVDGPDDSDWDELWANLHAGEPASGPLTRPGPRSQWEFLAFPGEAQAGVVVYPSADPVPGERLGGRQSVPVVQTDDGRWLIEFWAFGSQPATEIAEPDGGWDRQSPSDPFVLDGPAGGYAYRIDGRGPLVAMDEIAPGRYQASGVSHGDLIGHELMLVRMDATAFAVEHFVSQAAEPAVEGQSRS